MNRIKCFFGLSLALGAVLTVGVSARPPKMFGGANALYPASLEPTYVYTEGVKSKLAGNPQRAEACFRYVIKLDSTHAPSYYELAGLYMENDPKTALPFSLKSNALDSTNVWYRGQLGRLMLITGQYDKAFAIYDDLVRLDPRNPDNYRMLAALYGEKGQPFAAMTVLDSAQYKLGRIEELSDMKRQMLIDLKMYDKAISESKSLIEDYPWSADNYRILATLYAQTGEDSLAVTTFNTALKLDPSDLQTISALNTYYRRKGDTRNFFSTAQMMMASPDMQLSDKLSMINELRANNSVYEANFFQIKALVSTLLIKYPEDPKVNGLWGTMVMQSDGVEKGLEFYKGHLESSWATIDLYNAVMDVETYLKRPDSLIKYATLAAKRFKPEADLYARVGGSLSYMERDKEALGYLEKALKYSKTDSMRSVVLGFIGDAYHKMNDFKSSYDYYRRALKAWPDNSSVLNNFSYFLTTTGPDGTQIELAVEMSKRACELAPGNATFLDTYGWALFKAGRFMEAKKIMMQAISLDTSDSETLYVHYGDILYALKDYFMASVYWKKALDKGYDADEINERLKKIEGK